MTKSKLPTLFFMSFTFIVPVLVSAQNDRGGGPGGNNDRGGGGIANPLGSIDNVFDLFFAIIQNVLLPLAAIVAVLAIIYAGFQFIAALGRPEKLVTAKRNFVYVLVGTLLLLGAYSIGLVIRSTICEISGGTPEVLCSGQYLGGSNSSGGGGGTEAIPFDEYNDVGGGRGLPGDAPILY